MSFFLTALSGSIIYHLIDKGITNGLVLQDFGHGSNIFSNLSMRWSGGIPSYGGSADGSTFGDDDYNHRISNLENRFFVFKDSEFKQDIPGFDFFTYVKHMPTLLKTEPVQALVTLCNFFPFLGKRVAPKYHAYRSGYNFAARRLPEKSPCFIVRISRLCLGVISGIFSLIFSPTLQFRFSKIDESFENDRHYCGIAYCTSKKVEAWRIGLMGSLITGVNFDWFARVKAHPSKFLTGVAQLTCAVALIALGMNLVLTNPALLDPLLVGALLV